MFSSGTDSARGIVVVVVVVVASAVVCKKSFENTSSGNFVVPIVVISLEVIAVENAFSVSLAILLGAVVEATIGVVSPLAGGFSEIRVVPVVASGFVSEKSLVVVSPLVSVLVSSSPLTETVVTH